ncbi:alpha/beta fold hydrolase [Pseudonocardiaceae bacterium YIM PH 21723]|nr:alpha/beta fold hydrolase [Pseudonocardiaceae bacterium YIM PH 21723]
MRKALVTTLIALGLLVPAAAVAEPGPAQRSFVLASAYAAKHPDADPPGANDWNCDPGDKNPIVLLHGTTENAYNNWAGLAPKLKAAGYCVFAPNIGGKPGNAFQGLQDIDRSTEEFGIYVKKVLAATGKTKVDIIGHSQGGMLPRNYIKRQGGGKKVDRLIALAPSNHGTVVWFPFTKVPGGSAVLASQCVACVQQSYQSDWIKALNAGGETVPQVKYTNIITREDEVVVPHQSSYLPQGPNVRNVAIQDIAPFTVADHLELSYNHVAHDLVFEALQ